jgi:O-antigen ligase
MITLDKSNIEWHTKENFRALSIRFSPFLFTLRLLTILLFCQIWFDTTRFTIRLEDIVILVLISSRFLPFILRGKLCYRQHLLSIPLLVWCSVLLFGVGVTLVSPFDSEVKKDALINGVRLVLAVGIFFVIYHHPTPAEIKLKTVVSTMGLFSLVTTTVALLQMGYWDGWMPVPLPSALTTFKEGANTAQGRELFALYLGDTGSHTWSAALAMQALLMWLLGRYSRSPWRKMAMWLYFGLLVFILFRVSVRNSILGLFITIIGLELLGRKQTRVLIFRILRVMFVFTLPIIILVALFYLAPDSYSVERVRQAIPTFEKGQVVISRGGHLLGRFDYWSTAFEIFIDSPMIGGGFYSYQTLSGLYGPEPIVHAHNSYFQTLAELGLIGAVALSLLIASTAYFLIRSRRYFMRQVPNAYWWEMVAGSFIFLVFTAIFGNPFWSPNYVAFRMIAVGVLASLVREQKR